ncbi:MAG: methylaspartate mutase subunit E [Chloroflexota bacterium]
MEITVRNKKWEEDRFLRERKDVLSRWPTGKEVDFEEAVEYHKGLPDYKNFTKVVQKLHQEGRTVIFPRGGTPILEQEIELNKALFEAGLPVIPLTPDSYCRLGQYAKAQRGLEESIKAGQPKLNGYPTVIHGVRNTRKVVENTEAALNQRLTNIGGIRLMAEIAFAAGITAALVDPLLTFGWYEKKTTAAESIEEYQYVQRLIGYYAERGVTIANDTDGINANLQFPMSVDIASVIIVGMLGAEQGVKSVIPRISMFGHLAQDIAWARVLRKLMREYLDKFGYADVIVPGLALDQVPLFPHPQDMGMSFGFLSYSATVAALAEGEIVYVRTIDEAAGIPSKEAHAVSYRAAKFIFDVIRAQKIDLDIESIKTEERITELEVRAIMDRVLDLGDGDVAVGFEKGVQTGAIDCPLSGNVNLKSKVLGIRDNHGACRYLDFGNLPIPEEAREFHREKVAEREQAEGRKIDLNAVIQDFWAFSKGKIKGEPASCGYNQPG